LRNPIKWFYVTSLAVGVLAILGVGAIEERIRSGAPATSWRLVTTVLLIPAAAVFIPALAFLAGKSAHPTLFWDSAAALDHARASLAIGLLFWSLAAASVAWLLRTRTSATGGTAGPFPRPASILLVTVLIVELWYVDSHYLPYHPSIRPLPNDPLSEMFNREPRPFRVHFAGVPLYGYFEYLVGQYGLELMSPGSSRLADERSGFFQSFSSNPGKLLRLSNVRFLIAPGSLRDPQFKPIFQFGGEQPVSVYRFTNELPRYFLVSRWTVVPDPVRRFTSLLSPDFDPATSAILHENQAAIPSPPEQPDPTARCTVSSYKMHRVELVTESARDAVLVALDRFHPNWSVYVDDREVPLWRADGVMRACHVPAGRHTVSFRLRGEGITPMIVVGLGLLMTLVVVWAAARDLYTQRLARLAPPCG
jgi:hypothetical protein